MRAPRALLDALTNAKEELSSRTSWKRKDALGMEASDASESMNVDTSTSASNGTKLSSLRNKRVSREELGRCTWTFLHTLAAQLPDKPTKQQKKDVKQLLDLLTRIYPCGECASHFQELLHRHPPKLETNQEFSNWMCEIHNEVNVRLHKPKFDCRRVDARWKSLSCDEEEDMYCDLLS